MTTLDKFYSDQYIINNRDRLPHYVYDVEITFTNGTVYKPFRGLIFVNPEVTQI